MISAEPPPPALGLRHVALRVLDLDAAERFFVDLLGYRVEWRPDDENVYLIRHHDNVALHRVAEAPGAGLLDHVGILVQRAEDVDAWAPEGLLVQIIHHPPALR